MNHATLIRYHLQLLLLVYPTWSVIGAQLGYFTGLNEYASLSRYLIIFSLIFFLFAFYIFAHSAPKMNFGLALLFFFLVYCLLHVFGDVELLLVVEGFRHELLFVIVSFCLIAFGLTQKNTICLPSIKFIFYTIILNGVVAVAFGIWQFMDSSILEFLYRKPVDEIGNLTLAIGIRIASTMVNPINFGAYMVLFMIATYYVANSKISRILFYFIILPVVVTLVLASYSRLALIALSVTMLFILIRHRYFFAMLPILILIIGGGFFLFDHDVIEPVLDRTQTLLEIETFSGNDRVSNWGNAISSLDPYQYLWGRGIGASSPDSVIVSQSTAVSIENAFISTFVQYGIIGFVFQILIMIRYLYIGISLRDSHPDFGSFVAAFILFFFTMSIGNDFFRNSPFVYYYWILYAQVELIYREVVKCKVKLR